MKNEKLTYLLLLIIVVLTILFMTLGVLEVNSINETKDFDLKNELRESSEDSLGFKNIRINHIERNGYMYIRNNAYEDIILSK